MRARHAQIEQQQIGILLRSGQRIQVIGVVGFEDLRLGPALAQHPAQGFAKQRMVIGDE